MNPLIAVVGGSNPSPETDRLAEAVGRCIASIGATLVCGGLGGVMASAGRGAKEAGGLTVGILPGYDPASANPFIDIPICTGMGHARNAIIAATASALIALEGSYGTLSEISLGPPARAPCRRSRPAGESRGGPHRREPGGSRQDGE